MNSKKKHNILFTKPAEPAFLTRLKQQAGYVEGPNVDTKNETLPEILDEDCEDREDEKPVVVVMKDGDLTEEEANLITKAQEQKQVEKAVDKADLSQRIIFKRKKNSDNTSSTELSNTKKVKKKKPSKPVKTVLSFNDEEED